MDLLGNRPDLLLAIARDRMRELLIASIDGAGPARLAAGRRSPFLLLGRGLTALGLWLEEVGCRLQGSDEACLAAGREQAHA